MLHSRLISSALIAAIISLSAEKASSAFVITSNSSARKLPVSHANGSDERNENDEGEEGPVPFVPVPPTTASPTISPTAPPSVSPSASPTASPTSSPTSSPTASPTVSPTKAGCASNGDGSFGETSGSEVTEVTVIYNFEMVTAADGVVSDALNNLETSITNLILGSTLGCTVENRRNLNIDFAQRKRYLKMTGISALPGDVVTGNVCTRAISSSDENCSVIEGKMKLYVSENADTYKMAVLNEIENGMGFNGELVNSDDSITNLVFFTPAPIGPVSPPGTQNSENEDNGSGPRANGSLSLGGTVAGAVCAFILVGFFTGRKMMKKKEDGEVDDADGPDLEAVNLNDPSFDANNQSGLHSILNSSGSVTVSSSFAT